MAWEKRERGGCYYTRSRRDGGGVLREYLGTGPFAELAAQMDSTRRELREAEREGLRQELEQLKALSAPVLELDHAAAVLAGPISSPADTADTKESRG